MYERNITKGIFLICLLTIFLACNKSPKSLCPNIIGDWHDVTDKVLRSTEENDPEVLLDSLNVILAYIDTSYNSLIENYSSGVITFNEDYELIGLLFQIMYYRCPNNMTLRISENSDFSDPIYEYEMIYKDNNIMILKPPLGFGGNIVLLRDK